MPRNRDKIGGTGKKFENKTVKTGGFAGIAGRIAAFSAVFCCLLCLAGMMWGYREDSRVGANSNWIDESSSQEGYGFQYDKKVGENYIVLNSSGVGSSMTIKTNDQNVTGVSISKVGTKIGDSNNSNVAYVDFTNSGASTCSAFGLYALGGGKTSLTISPESINSSLTTETKTYEVYVQPHFTNSKEEIIDINDKEEERVINTNIVGNDSSIGYIISTKSDFKSAYNGGADSVSGNLGTPWKQDFGNSGNSSNDSIVWKWDGKKFTVTPGKSIGIFYIYLYIINDKSEYCDIGDCDRRVDPVSLKVVCRTTLRDVTVSLNAGDFIAPYEVNITGIYNFNGFLKYFNGGSLRCDYDNTTGIIKTQSNENVKGQVVLDTVKNGEYDHLFKECLFHEDGKSFADNGSLEVTVYTIDQLAFLEKTGSETKLVTNIEDKKVAKGGAATLSFVYTTSTVPTWTSDNVSIATVENGVVRGINPGRTTIRGSVISGGKKKEITCNVTVAETKDILVLLSHNYQATLNQVFRLDASGSAVKAGKVQWVVSNDDILEITKRGVSSSDGMSYVEIMPKKTGTAVVSIYDAENAIMDSCSVTVGVVPTKLEFSNGMKELTLNMSAKTYQLTVNMTPPDPFAPLIWQSNNTKVAEVNQNGLVTLKGPGVAIIHVVPEYYQQISATITINVTQPTTGLTIDIPEATMSVGEKLKLSYTLTPETATNKTVSWFSMDSKIASVDKNGLVTAKKIGVTYIYAVSQDGSYLAFSTITVIQAATGVKLDSNNLSLKVGDVYYLQATFTPNNATDKRLTWVSQDTKVCTVTNTGKVTAVNPGKTTIYAKTASGEVTFINVTVQANVLGLDLDETEKSVLVGRKFTLTPIFTPDEPTNQKVTWRSSNTGIATVDKDGNVVTKKVGMTVIVCTSLDGGYMANCAVTVRPGVSGLELDEKELRLKVGKSRKLNVTFTPEHPSSKKVKWKSSNPSVATVNDKGKVKALKGGSTIITCTSAVNDVSASCVVMVEQLITYIKLNKSTAYVGVGRTTQLRAKVDSNDVTNKQLKWTSNNTGIATVDKNGNVTGKARGTCYITCSATDGSKAKARCKIRVIRQITSLSLDKTTIRLVEGKSTRIRAIYKPSNAEHKKVTWSSTDEKIATIDRKGNIYAVAEGVCKIKAKAADGSGKRAECWLYVLKRVEASSVVISQRDLYMPVGDTENLNVSVLPANSTDSVSFSSDNKLIASVSNTGRVRALRPGQAVITCTTSSGKTATSTVTVLGLNWTSLNMRLYDSQTLRLEGMTTGVIWESEDKSVATVDTSGLVIARKPGTTRIIATVKGIKLYCRITVSGSI